MTAVSVWVPTAKQAEFLSAPEYEVLYGGAAGGGKTDALIIDVLGLKIRNGPDGCFDASWKNPAYRAILIRPSRTELNEVLDRCLKYYPMVDPGVKWTSTKFRFTFSSGAMIYFAYLKTDADKYQFAGQEFQYAGWEELTQHPSSGGYLFLKSRIRAPKSSFLPCFIRATTNPNGPGHEWVKSYFQINDDGEATNFVVEQHDGAGQTRRQRRRFIPAKVEDNPHIDEDYVFRLSDLDEYEHSALRFGRWDAPDGPALVFRDEVRMLINDNRLTMVPWDPTTPVNTFWDLGVSDATAIWFHQRIGMQDRFIRYLENRQKPLSFYAKILKELPYVYGTHYLPHDGNKRAITDLEMTPRRALEDLEVLPIRLVPISSVSMGIDKCRNVLASCWIDIHNCSEGWKALKNYQNKLTQAGNQSANPPRQKWSHGVDAFRMFAVGYKGDSRASYAERYHRPDETRLSRPLTRRELARQTVRNIFNPSPSDIL